MNSIRCAKPWCFTLFWVALVPILLVFTASQPAFSADDEALSPATPGVAAVSEPECPDDMDEAALRKTRKVLKKLLQSKRLKEALARKYECEPPGNLGDDEALLERMITMWYLAQLALDGTLSGLLEADPLCDLDGDGFTAQTWPNGTAFRGTDCNDKDPETHPLQAKYYVNGTLGEWDPDDLTTLPVPPLDIDHDSNCNGIYGVDPDTEFSYEDQFCTNYVVNYPDNLNPYSMDRAVVVFGDSLVSGFNMDAACLDPDVDFLECLTQRASSVFSSPEQSFVTGQQDGTIFKRLFKEQNRCMQGQWMNFATPGAKREDLMDQIKQLPPIGKPVIVVIGFGYGDTCIRNVDDVITPEELVAIYEPALDELDRRLTMGSRVLLLGMPRPQTYLQGLVLPDKDCFASDIWVYMSCLGVNPCPNILSLDTSAVNWRITLLHQTLLNLVISHHYKYMKLYYLDTNTVSTLIRHAVADDILMYNEVDGMLHVRLSWAGLQGSLVYDHLNTMYPHFLMRDQPPNPSNDAIIEKFPDIGGD